MSNATAGCDVDDIAGVLGEAPLEGIAKVAVEAAGVMESSFAEGAVEVRGFVEATVDSRSNAGF